MSIVHWEHLRKNEKEFNVKLDKVYERLERLTNLRDHKMEACQAHIRVNQNELEKRLSSKIAMYMSFIVIICSVLTGILGAVIANF